MTQRLTTERHDRIAVVRINRPQQRNALNVELIEQLHQTAIALGEETDIDAIVLGGSKNGFSAGADRKDPRIFEPDSAIYEHWRSTEHSAKSVEAWRRLPQPTIAAIEAFAVGGAFSFAMACDFRVMGRSAFVSIPEVDLGFNYGWNSIPQMINLVGPARTKRLVLLGERISAEDAERWGLVDYLAEDGKADDTALRLAEMLANKPKLSLQLSKKAINATAGAFADTASHADMAQILLCFQSLKEQKRS